MNEENIQNIITAAKIVVDYHLLPADQFLIKYPGSVKTPYIEMIAELELALRTFSVAK